jgi:hypothetical protein
MTNVQSVITATNGATPILAKGKAKAKASTSLGVKPAKVTMTPAQACDIAFEYGQTMAGQDGALTNAFLTFKDNEPVIQNMVQALTEGYMVRKLGYDRDEATRVIGLKKYNQLNPAKNTDENRSFDQERVMTAVRVLVSRAKRMAGVTKPADTAEQEATRAAKEAEKANHESRLIKADEIVNPADDVDAFDALNRLVLTMKSLQKKYAAKLVGDRGSEWRDWLANAPR